MNKKLAIAVVAQVALMLAGLVSPLAVKATGSTIYLETRPVDPRALFRGDYVTLAYVVGQTASRHDLAVSPETTGRPVYVTVTTERPAEFVAAGLERPDLENGQACLTGRLRRSGNSHTLDFPQIAQYFVPEGEGGAIEQQLREGLVAEIKVSGRCNAVLLGLEPR